MADAHLDGTLEDLGTVERLYREDREADALRVLDRILGIKSTGLESIRWLRTLLQNPGGHAPLVNREARMPDGRLKIELGLPELFNAMIPQLIILRCKCFSALCERTPKDKALADRARENCGIAYGLFPKNVEVLVLVAQVTGMVVGLEPAVELLEEAAVLEPNHAVVRGNAEIFAKNIKRAIASHPGEPVLTALLRRAERIAAGPGGGGFFSKLRRMFGG